MKRTTGTIAICFNKDRIWLKLTNIQIEADCPADGEAVAPNDFHVTFVRNERPLLKDNLPRIGKRVSFEYDSQVKTNGRKYWIDVVCPELANIRDAMGLKKQPTFPFHITIANVRQPTK